MRPLNAIRKLQDFCCQPCCVCSPLFCTLSFILCIFEMCIFISESYEGCYHLMMTSVRNTLHTHSPQCSARWSSRCNDCEYLILILEYLLPFFSLSFRVKTGTAKRRSVATGMDQLHSLYPSVAYWTIFLKV